MGNLEVVPAGFTHRALHIEMPRLLNTIMRRSCIETTAERTMNPAADHFCLSGLTPRPRWTTSERFFKKSFSSISSPILTQRVRVDGRRGQRSIVTKNSGSATLYLGLPRRKLIGMNLKVLA
ncbi:hypothetical protein ACVWWI_006603 [Bradyrhizobium sp. USDA 3686]|uniref:hypothetical protein n=1 Tax=Bradyrhizobium canariense TaxID=255045 RepID=UPI00195CEEEE|nr:hypothetical protein [Bradyrhizobium canariense]MBM7487846.1 hypothetical protein [Bradyrhizobium canariense]